VNILQAMADPKLFKPWFKNPETWEAWTAFLACLFNLPMDDEQRAIVLACTGLQELPERAFFEALLLCGRRGGKSLILAMLAVFLAVQGLDTSPVAWRAAYAAEWNRKVAQGGLLLNGSSTRN
jgi:hypothetical protein